MELTIRKCYEGPLDFSEWNFEDEEGLEKLTEFLNIKLNQRLDILFSEEGIKASFYLQFDPTDPGNGMKLTCGLDVNGWYEARATTTLLDFLNFRIDIGDDREAIARHLEGLAKEIRAELEGK